ncbi:MAG: hypothetical protein ACXWJ8_03900 [Xanthobacteraceae bacterium]
MGYFDALTSSAFKTADDGRKLFFPWGTLGRGYILGSDEDDARLRGQIKIFMIAALGLIVVSGALQSYLASAVVTPVLVGFYAVWMAYLLRGLQPSDERMSWRESLTSQALTHGAVALWSLEIGSLAFVVIGAFIFVFDPANWLTGIASMIFFGLCAAVFAAMLAVRNRPAAH